MKLQDEIMELVKEISNLESSNINKAIILHTKAHMFHNKKIHKKAVEELKKYNLPHAYVDRLDE